MIHEYDKRHLPKNWQHTQFKDHLRYKGRLIKVIDRNRGMVELVTDIDDERSSVLGHTLENAMFKMEAKFDNK